MQELENYVLRFKDDVGNYRYIGKCFWDVGCLRISFSLNYIKEVNKDKMKRFTKEKALELTKDRSPVYNFWLVNLDNLSCSDVLEAININRIEKE